MNTVIDGLVNIGDSIVLIHAKTSLFEDIQYKVYGSPLYTVMHGLVNIDDIVLTQAEMSLYEEIQYKV